MLKNKTQYNILLHKSQCIIIIIKYLHDNVGYNYHNFNVHNTIYSDNINNYLINNMK